VSAPAIAREAIDYWLRQQVRQARHDAITAFAVGAVGASLDLDEELECARVATIW